MRQQRIDWLNANHLPALPIAPAQDPYRYPRIVPENRAKGIYEHVPIEIDEGVLKPKPAFTGKNPSYLDGAGNPRLINHHHYQSRLPNEREQRQWFTNPANGIATLGNDRIAFVDIDRKHFKSQAECDLTVAQWMQAHPELKQTYSEKTHSGGWHVAVELPEKKTFTNFSLEPGGQHVGEVLGRGRVCVLAPTIGPSDHDYETQHQANPIQIESLASIGLYKSGRAQETLKPHQSLPKSKIAFTATAGATPLAELISPKAQDILFGHDPYSDRSFALTTFAREAFGWQNWATDNHVPLADTAMNLTHHAGDAHQIDPERVDRIIDTIEPQSARPAAELFDDLSPWKRLRKVDRGTYETHCPKPQKDTISQAYQAYIDQAKVSLQQQPEILQLAHTILQQVGQPTSDDGLGFHGKHHGIDLSKTGEVRLTRDGKTILKHQDGKTVFSRVSAEDVRHFRQCVQYLDQMPRSRSELEVE